MVMFHFENTPMSHNTQEGCHGLLTASHFVGTGSNSGSRCAPDLPNLTTLRSGRLQDAHIQDDNAGRGPESNISAKVKTILAKPLDCLIGLVRF